LQNDDAQLDEWEDSFFGLLRWDTTFGEWRGYMHFPLHDVVELGLPLEYRDSPEMQSQIQNSFRVIERDELAFRERAAQEIFAKGRYILFWPEDIPYQADEFARRMHLGAIVFEPQIPDKPLTLGYEYGEGVDYGINIYLTWDGNYKNAR
jgi:hypothetical protein